MYPFLIALYIIGFASLSAIAANTKNRDPVGWFFIGLLFGVFGLAAALIVEKIDPSADSNSSSRSKGFDASEMTRKCPDCAEMIKLEARVCRFCNRQFSESEVSSLIATVESQFMNFSDVGTFPHSDVAGTPWANDPNHVSGSSKQP